MFVSFAASHDGPPAGSPHEWPHEDFMFYQLYEFNHAALQPARAYVDAVQDVLFQSAQPVLAHAAGPLGGGDGRTVRAHHAPLRQAGVRPRPRRWSTGKPVPVTERSSGSGRSATSSISSATCPRAAAPSPKLLIVAPMSGHYATLLRGTVEAMLPHADVYITDWADARMVPLTRRPLRSRRLHRLRHRHAACARPGHPCDGGVPAFGAGAGGGGGDGGARRPLRAGDR